MSRLKYLNLCTKHLQWAIQLILWTVLLPPTSGFDAWGPFHKKWTSAVQLGGFHSVLKVRSHFGVVVPGALQHCVGFSLPLPLKSKDKVEYNYEKWWCWWLPWLLSDWVLALLKLCSAESRSTDRRKGQETGGWKEDRDLGVESSLILREFLPETSVFPAPQKPLLLGSQLPPGRFAWIQLSLWCPSLWDLALPLPVPLPLFVVEQKQKQKTTVFWLYIYMTTVKKKPTKNTNEIKKNKNVELLEIPLSSNNHKLCNSIFPSCVFLLWILVN